MALKSSQIPRRCEAPDCNHEHDTEGEPMYLHGVCHLESPVEVYVVGDEAVVRCYVCKREVVRLALVP